MNWVLLIYSCPYHFPPTINAANILAEKGEKVYLLGIKYPETYSQHIHDNVELCFVDKLSTKYRGLLGYVMSIFFLAWFVIRKRINIIVSYDNKSVIPAFIASRLKKITWVYHQHDYWDYPKGVWNRFLWKMERILANKANIVSFPQANRALLFQQEARLIKAPLVVFNGPRKNWDSHIASPNPIITHLRKQFDFILVYQGGWSKYFGIEKIFYALANCKTNTCLIVLGEEREPEVKKYYDEIVRVLKLEDRVWFSNTYIAYDELPSFTKFSDAAIAILTKDNENAPYNNRYLIGASNKIFEYISFGLPVFTQNSEPNRNFYLKYPIGVTIDADDPIDFARKIDSLLSDKKSIKEFRDKNIHLFNSELNFDYQFNKLFSAIISQHHVDLE